MSICENVGCICCNCKIFDECAICKCHDCDDGNICIKTCEIKEKENKMLALITKASDDYWYKFEEISNIEDLLKIDEYLIIKPNHHDEDEIPYWRGFKEKDISKLKKAKIEIQIYDDYVE